MVYNFKERFAGLIESGQKLTTIRAPRKDGKLPKPGEVLKLFTGMRTKKCRKIGERVCKSVRTIKIGMFGMWIGPNQYKWSNPAHRLNFDIIARGDGFAGWFEMRAFFTQVHGLPFTGYLIEWYPRLSGEPFNPGELEATKRK